MIPKQTGSTALHARRSLRVTEEIQRILKNEEHKALEKNPFERVIRKIRDDDKLVIETTDKKLAEHLGRVLHKAHRGKLDISWAGDPNLCRVSWERVL
jgi:hypothetical protein